MTTEWKVFLATSFHFTSLANLNIHTADPGLCAGGLICSNTNKVIRKKDTHLSKDQLSTWFSDQSQTATTTRSSCAKPSKWPSSHSRLTRHPWAAFSCTRVKSSAEESTGRMLPSTYVELVTLHSFAVNLYWRSRAPVTRSLWLWRRLSRSIRSQSSMRRTCTSQSNHVSCALRL